MVQTRRLRPRVVGPRGRTRPRSSVEFVIALFVMSCPSGSSHGLWAVACALSSAKNNGCIDCAELFVFLEDSGQKCPRSFPSAPPPGWYGDPSSVLSEPLEQTSVVGFSYSVVGHDVLSLFPTWQRAFQRFRSSLAYSFISAVMSGTL